MNEQTSDTPRTDEAVKEHASWIGSRMSTSVHREFARTLERELNEERRQRRILDSASAEVNMRLREKLKIARKNLDAVYLMAWHKRDDEVAKLQSEIELLKQECQAVNAVNKGWVEAVSEMQESHQSETGALIDEVARLKALLSPKLPLNGGHDYTSGE